MHRPSTPRQQVSIHVLGRFEVRVDGAVVPERAWSRRSAAALVKVLALAPNHRLHREQVIDLLWPDDAVAEAAPKLHKAAHYARKTAGRSAVVLRNDVVVLFPDAHLTVDVALFDELSRVAVAGDDAIEARAAIDYYGGELLPDDRYEEWAVERRELLRLRHLHLLRLAGRWSELGELEDTRDAVEVSTIDTLLAELAELNRRQAAVLDQLARVGVS